MVWFRNTVKYNFLKTPKKSFWIDRRVFQKWTNNICPKPEKIF